MYKLLVKLMLTVAILQLGWTFLDMRKCLSGDCRPLEKASKNILKISWKPISVWPEEAKQFHSYVPK